MTKTVRFYKAGGPEVLKLVDVEVPRPGKNEVRIRVKAIGLNRAEAMYRSGGYIHQPVFPAQLGYEAAGEIEAVGEGVKEFAPGDKVSVVPAFHFKDYGMCGESVLAPARAVVKHPESLSWEEAAATWMQFVTAWGALIDIAKLSKGDAIVIPAASSSVGLAAIQTALSVGARPIALTRTGKKVAELIEAGATHVIASEEQDLVREILNLTDGKGARVVFDPVGGPDFAKLAQATKTNGIIFLYGLLSSLPAPFPTFEVLGRHLTIRGYELFEVTTDDQQLANAKRFIVDGLASGVLRPRVGKTFPLSQIVEAHRYMEANAQIGKIVVTVP
jgi:NADPH:quinone reductase-like Zn-dependent oxidoreductase